MLSSLLVPLDGSPLAERAVPYATALARAARAKLILLHATPDLGLSPASDTTLTRVADRLRGVGVEAEPYVFYLPYLYDAGVAGAISDAAVERHAGLIVMSTHGRGGLGRFIYGSVADRVLRQAEVPVLLVPPACVETWPEERVRRVLVPLDGSELAEAALGPAGELAELFDAEILLLRVTVSPSYVQVESYDSYPAHDLTPEGDPAPAREYLEGIAATLRATGRKVATQVATGHPPMAITSVARERNADLIVLSTHGRGGLGRVVQGSVATGVLQHATVPLVAARPAAVRRATSESDRAAEESDALTITLTLSRRELDLVRSGLQELLEGARRDRRLAAHIRQILAQLKQAESSAVERGSSGPATPAEGTGGPTTPPHSGDRGDRPA